MKKLSILPALFLVFTACNNSGEEPTAKKEMYSELVAENLKEILLPLKKLLTKLTVPAKPVKWIPAVLQFQTMMKTGIM